MKNILIAGSTGKVGRAWLRRADSIDGLHATGLGGSSAFDLATSAGVQSVIRRIQSDPPDLFVHSAAMTNVDHCEQDQVRTLEVNAQSVTQIAAACAEVGAGLIFYSTDHVFDGTGPKAEDGTLAPLNVYGISKVQAEESVRTSKSEHLIIRINVPLANATDRSNFYSFVAGRLASNEAVQIVTDQWNNPLDTGRIAQWSFESWQQGLRGTLHLGGGSYLTRYDIARLIADHLQKTSDLIRPITTDQLGQTAQRPRRGGLLIARQTDLFGTAPDLPTILKSLH